MKIRPATPDDATTIAEIYRPFVENSVVTFDERAPTASEFAARVSAAADVYPWLVAADADGRVTGYACASQHRARTAYRWSVDVAIYLAEDFRGAGLGRKLYSALFDELRRLNFYNAYAGITIPNAASRGLHVALGFEPIGVYRNVGYKMGRWLDVEWLALRLQGSNERPIEPASVDAQSMP